MEWINVKDKLPDKTGEYLVIIKRHVGNEDEFLDRRIAYYFSNWEETESKWKWQNNINPLYWMELPVIPK